MQYYISDQHFFCNRIMKQHKAPLYIERGFSNVAEMNRCMIKRWNSKVMRDDDVYILGDFSEGNAEETISVIKSLSGKKYLIEGNFDSVYLTDSHMNTDLFQWVKQYAELEDDSRTVDLFHYPIICYHGASTGAYMLYGHMHSDLKAQVIISQAEDEIKTSRGTKFYKNHIINCYCSDSNYVPLTLDEWIAVNTRRRQQVIKDDTSVN